MNNKQDNKSLIAFRRGLSSFLIYGIFLVLVIVMTIIDLIIGKYNPVFDKIGSIVVCVLLGLSIVSFILALIAISSASGVNTYFAKLGLFYGIFTVVIWAFLIFSYFIFILTHISGVPPSLKQKILFYIMLTILSLAPLALHIWYRIKFTKNE